MPQVAPPEIAALFPANAVGHFALPDLSGIAYRHSTHDAVYIDLDPVRARQIAAYAGQAGVLSSPHLEAVVQGRGSATRPLPDAVVPSQVALSRAAQDVLQVEGPTGPVVILPQALIGDPLAQAFAAEHSAPVPGPAAAAAPAPGGPSLGLLAGVVVLVVLVVLAARSVVA